MTGRRRRVVIFGGTFDPIHRGHLSVLRQVKEGLPADSAILIPAGTPPHRPLPIASADDRLALARAAAEDYDWLEVSDREIDRPGPAYTLDTWEELCAERPADEFWLMLGADAARGIRHWHRSADLLQRGRFVVIDRRGTVPLTSAELRGLGFPAGRTRWLRVNSPDVSATAARRALVSSAEAVERLIPDSVAALIAVRGLYRGIAPAVP